MGKTTPTEAYKFVGHLPGGFAMFVHKVFFFGKPFVMTREQCENRLQKLINQGMPCDQTLAALSGLPPETKKTRTVH